VPRGHQGAVYQEGHAADLRVLRRLHLRDHLHLFCVPHPNPVVEGARDYLRVIRDFFLGDPFKLFGLQGDYFEERPFVALHVLGLEPPLDAENAEGVIRLDEEAASVREYFDLSDLLIDNLLGEEGLLMIYI